jgi:hypothetical protein
MAMSTLGIPIIRNGYLDQIFCAASNSTTATCVVTAANAEGVGSEHELSITSRDGGATWGPPVHLEPEANVTNSNAAIVVAPSGRLYALYSMNVDRIDAPACRQNCASRCCQSCHSGPHRRPAPAVGNGCRTDLLGHFVLKYSDNVGASWSEQRWDVPYPLTAIDRQNVFNGTVKMMWTVDQFKVRNGVAWLGFTKIGGFPQAPPQELFFLSSKNLLSESDPAKIKWQLAPDADHGLLPPFCPALRTDSHCGFFEEAHILPLRLGHYAAGRSAQGFLGVSSTADPTARSGWAPTTYARYWDPLRAPMQLVPLGTARANGLKHPRGPLLIKEVLPGKILLLFFNNRAGEPWVPALSGSQRNPYWISAGTEVAGTVLWSQPEVALFVRGTSIKDGTLLPDSEAGGYADFLWLRAPHETKASLHITETDKSVARIHRVDIGLLAGLWTQHNATQLAPRVAITIEASDSGRTLNRTVDFPSCRSNESSPGAGWSVALLLTNHAAAAAGQRLLDDRNSRGQGVWIEVAANGGLTLGVSDGNWMVNLSTDVAGSAALRAETPSRHVVVFAADASAQIMSVLVDGVLCDGAGVALRGFGWLPPLLAVVPASKRQLHVAVGYAGSLLKGHVWRRSLTTSEAVSTTRSLLKNDSFAGRAEEDAPEDATADRVDTTFGARRLRFDPDKGFFLNDLHVKIKGICNHQDFGGVGVAVPDRINAHRVRALKEMGANAWRCAHNPPNPELLDAADEQGMLVWDENRIYGPHDSYDRAGSSPPGHHPGYEVARRRCCHSVRPFTVTHRKSLYKTVQGAAE